MRSYHLSDMKYGWFCGDFEPKAHEMKSGEIAVKKMVKGRRIIGYYHPNAVVSVVLLQGSVCCEKKAMLPGDCLLANPGESISLYALEDSVLLYVVYGDTAYSRNQQYDWKSISKLYEMAYPCVIHPKQADDRFDDLSVIVQGAIDKAMTPLTLRRIRKLFPTSTIILSTWEGQEVDGLEYDILVKSKDPGGCINHIIEDFDIQYTNNVNRQLISIQEGLKKVSTKYTLKIRTDMLPCGNEFVRYFDAFPQRTEECRLFEHKVLISDFFARHYFAPRSTYVPLLFHPSDWFFFGLTSDLRLFFADCAPMSRRDAGEYAALKNKRIKIENFCQWNARFVPEQFYAVSALQRNGIEIDMEDWTDINETNMWQSEQFMINNFIPLDYKRHKIMLPKYDVAIRNNEKGGVYATKGLYTFDVYEKVYDYLFGVKNESYYDEKWDVEQFYVPYKAIQQHHISMMAHLEKEGKMRLPPSCADKIDSSQVSVVVQGHIDSEKWEAHAVIDSIRKQLPGARIILSTWKGCRHEGLEYDECVLSEDPGEIKCMCIDGSLIPNNYNRQLISTNAGLERVNTAYTLKIRADMIMLGDGILSCFGNRDGRIDRYCVFSDRILVGEFFSRKSYHYRYESEDYSIPTPFHPSDWFAFGKTADIREYYGSAQLLSDAEAGNYSAKYAMRAKQNAYPFSWRFPPEQQFCMGVIRKRFPDVAFEDWSDWSEESMAFSESFMYSNFMILNFAQHEILLTKYDAQLYANSGYSYIEKGLLTNGDEMEWIRRQA